MTIEERQAVLTLCEAIMCLRSKDECEKFFSVFLSDMELSQIAGRVEIALLLYSGATYREIGEKISAANVTISRVKSVLRKDDSALQKIVTRMCKSEDL